jgi:hypothetical protein
VQKLINKIFLQPNVLLLAVLGYKGRQYSSRRESTSAIRGDAQPLRHGLRAGVKGGVKATVTCEDTQPSWCCLRANTEGGVNIGDLGDDR